MNKKFSKPIYWGIALFALISLSSAGAPWLSGRGPDLQPNPLHDRFLPPSLEHPFGTDQFGRDLFSRVLHGGRVSISLSLLAVGFSLLIGATYGAISGYFGGLTDRMMMRLVDALLCFPILFLAIAMIALFGSGLTMLFLIITLTSWMDIARLIRAEVIALKQRDFIIRCRASGFGQFRILFYHIAPNLLMMIIAAAVLRAADIILLESALSFLGLGAAPPTASWGAILSDGKMVFHTAWWMILFPGAAIILTILSLNIIGDSIKAVRNPL